MVQYVSNAGLVLVEEGIALGIDCFSRDSKELYPDTPDQIREQLLDAVEKGDLNILIFTHEHDDHFCLEDVMEAWKRNPKLQIYSGKRVIEILRQKGMAESSLVEIQEDAESKAPVWKEFGSIRIGFLYTQHEGAQYADVPNLTLLIEIGEKRTVVTGDAAPTEELFEQISAWCRSIDGFFLPFPYVGLHSTRKLLVEHLDIQKIFVLHQPRKEADAQGWVQSAKQICERATDGLPAPLFPAGIGNWYWL